jgi:hypothetical protein
MLHNEIREKIISSIYSNDAATVLSMIDSVVIVARHLPLLDRLMIAEALMGASALVEHFREKA